MLKRLYINNYAIIDELSVIFMPGFNTITGETGAGKSILMGALGLVLGQRADGRILRSDEKKCVVEASFNAKVSKEIKQFFLDEDLDQDEQITIRREITPNGKSRGFINDTPVNLAQLRGLTSLLVDLHQQFDILELGDDDFQRKVVDALANSGQIMQQYSEVFKKLTDEKKQLSALKEQQGAANKELDYQQFLWSELEEIGLKQNELENLADELQLLSNAENIKSVLAAATLTLKESEQPIVQQLKMILQQISGLKMAHPDLLAVVERLQSTQIELADIANEIERIDDNIGLDPERLQLANERLDTGYRLLKKHNVQTTDELLTIQKDLSQKLEKVLNIGDIITQKENIVHLLLQQAVDLAAQMSENRKGIVPSFETQTASLLKKVGMPNALLKVEILPSVLQSHGADQIQFLFDGNKSGRFEPLAKVASGGELSRLMLAIKSIVAGSMQLPTLIFDEIDTGISGEAARQIGFIMKELASRHQIIAITHQPQVAAKADAHYFVYKKETNGIVQTQMRLLNNAERVDAIANMLAGENPSNAVLQNAREMMGVNKEE